MASAGCGSPCIQRLARAGRLASFAAGEAVPCRFEFREHGSRFSLAVGADAMPAPRRSSAIIARLPGPVDRRRPARVAAEHVATGAIGSSIPELLAQNALVEAVARIEQHLHGDGVIHLDIDR